MNYNDITWCSGCWREIFRDGAYDCKKQGLWCGDCIKCADCRREPRGEKVFFYDFQDGVGGFANFGQRKRYLLCKECNEKQQDKRKNKEKQNSCLQCQKKPSVKEWVHFCGQSCAQKWIIENTETSIKISSDNNNDKGGYCKKCRSKITNKTGDIGIDDLLKYVEHSKKCSGKKKNDEKTEGKKRENNQSEPFDSNCSQCVKKLKEAKEYIEEENSKDENIKDGKKYRLKSSLICCHKSKCICQGGMMRSAWIEGQECGGCGGWKYYEVGGVGCDFTEIEPHQCRIRPLNDDGGNTINQPNRPVNTVRLLDQLERCFIENDIKLIKRENGKLVIEFNKENSTNNLTAEQQEQISNYLTKTNKSELSLSEIKRERERESKNPTNWTPLIIGGCLIGVVVVFVIIYALFKNKRRKY